MIMTINSLIDYSSLIFTRLVSAHKLVFLTFELILNRKKYVFMLISYVINNVCLYQSISAVVQ